MGRHVSYWVALPLDRTKALEATIRRVFRGLGRAVGDGVGSKTYAESARAQLSEDDPSDGSRNKQDHDGNDDAPSCRHHVPCLGSSPGLILSSCLSQKRAVCVCVCVSAGSLLINDSSDQAASIGAVPFVTRRCAAGRCWSCSSVVSFCCCRTRRVEGDWVALGLEDGEVM